MKHETKTQADIHLLGGFDYNINRETKTGTCLSVGQQMSSWCRTTYPLPQKRRKHTVPDYYTLVMSVQRRFLT